MTRRGLFSAEALQAIVTAHLESRADYSDFLLAYLTFELWQEGAAA